MAKRIKYRVLSDELNADATALNVEVVIDGYADAPGKSFSGHFAAFPITISAEATMMSAFNDAVAAAAQAHVRATFNLPAATITASDIVVPPWRKPAT